MGIDTALALQLKDHDRPEGPAMSQRWQASFIGAAHPAEAGDPAAYFRREFTVGPGLRSATLHVAGLGIVEPHLDGARVGDEVLEPGWTSYRHRVSVRAHDVFAQLSPGEHAVGAIVGEGWAVGRIGWEGERQHWADRPALFLQLALDYGDRTEFIGTGIGSGFTVGHGAVLANGIYDGETYDARLEPIGWNRSGFDDRDWANAQPFEWALDALILDAAPSVRRIEELAPVGIRTDDEGRFLVDFGQNFAGWVRLTVSGAAGQTITLRHAELLTPDGALEPATNRTAAATDRYILRGDGDETWEPGFTFHGFRYVEIDGWPGELTSDSIRGVVVHTDMQRTGWFETSNPLVSRLHDNALWSMRSNFVSLPTDCPQRDERMGWTGDLNAFAPTAALLYDVRGILGSWLADVEAEQRDKGYVPWAVPDVLPTPSAPTAIWSDVVVSLPWALYEEYGDLEILERHYDAMATFIRQVEGMLDASGLWSSGFQFGDWLDPDAPYDEPSAGKTDRHLVASAYLCRTTKEMADTAALLGRGSDAEHFGALAHRVRAAFHHDYVTASGRIINETATGYALAICFGIVDGEQRVKAGERLAQLVAKAGFHISTGFAGTPYVTEALSSTGHLDEAYLLLMQQESPSFLYPVTMGATTTWERWDSVLPDGSLNESGMTSLNHYALGAVAAWLYRTVGGLRRIEPGYRRIRIEPQPGGGLSWARTVHDTIAGRIDIAWRIEGGRVSLDVEIPDGVEAEIVLPFHPDNQRENVGAGRYAWDYDAPLLARTATFDMDTPLGEISAERTLWYRVTATLEKHFPGMSLDPSSPETARMPLSTLLGYIPTVPDGAEDELRALLGSGDIQTPGPNRGPIQNSETS